MSHFNEKVDLPDLPDQPDQPDQSNSQIEKLGKLYIAWLPSEKISMVKFVVGQLSKIADIDPIAKSHLEYISLHVSTDLIQSKFIAHHSTLFFNKATSIVEEGNTLYAYIKSLGWDETNVVLFIDFKREIADNFFITNKFENNDLTHITFICQRGKKGKPVNSKKVPKIIYYDSDQTIVSGTVCRLYKENSEKFIGGSKPTPVNKQTKKMTKHQLFLSMLVEKLNPEKSLIGSYMKRFSIDFQNNNPTQEEICTYIETIANK